MGLLDSNAPYWMPIDPISGNRLILEPEHGAIHAGTHFTITYPRLVSSAASVSSVFFTTPATSASKYIHFVCGIESDKAATWTLSEGATASGGSALTSYNNHRDNANTSGVVAVGTPTITTVGTILETHIIGTAGNPNSVTGGGADARNEWLLKPATSYLIQITVTAVTTNTVINIPYYYRERT